MRTAATGIYWAWNDGDVQRMVEAAGFDDIQMRRFPIAADHRVVNELLLRFGHDQGTLVVARKPVLAQPSDDVRAEEPAAVG